MDYSKMSDLQVNGRVLHYLSNGKAIRLQQASVASGETDYCNNPADAWPIIVNNRITVMIDDTTTEWSSASVQDFCDTSAFQHSNCHKNPLRAAMITFLMMQESSNVPANSTGSDLR